MTNKQFDSLSQDVQNLVEDLLYQTHEMETIPMVEQENDLALTTRLLLPGLAKSEIQVDVFDPGIVLITTSPSTVIGNPTEHMFDPTTRNSDPSAFRVVPSSALMWMDTNTFDLDKMTSKLENGILTLIAPKKPVKTFQNKKLTIL